MPTYRLTMEYDGTAYAGWQRQLHQPTVQEKLEEALRQIMQTRISVIAAGRTDAGVHARAQVVSFQCGKRLRPAEWLRALNGLLPSDIGITNVEEMPDGFHARYGAVAKEYEYRIFNGSVKPVLDRHRLWHVVRPLDIRAMQDAACFLAGQHDFSSFQGSPTDNDNPVCHIHWIEIIRNGAVITVRIQADRFLKQMVRAIVGTLVDIGHGKCAAAEMKAIIDAHDRRKAGRTAPPHGLYLAKVLYPHHATRTESTQEEQEKTTI